MGFTKMGYFQNETLVTLISVVIIFTLLFAIIYTNIYRTGIETSNSPIYFECPTGECATVIVTGEKTCPEKDDEKVLYDPEFQVCNSRFTCESEQTPYALQPDGSTDDLGRCPEGTICRCLQKPQCSINTMSTFSLTNGSLFMRDDSSSRSLYVQRPISAQGNTGVPVNIETPGTEFCAIKAFHMDRLSPGACQFQQVSNPTLQEISDCLNLNPCMVGVMGFVPEDSEKFVFNEDSIVSTPVTCLPGELTADGKSVCGLNKVPVWDNRLFKLICL